MFFYSLFFFFCLFFFLSFFFFSVTVCSDFANQRSCSFRENNQIIGSYLEIEDITLEDYGEYKCEVSNGVDEEITLPAHVYRQGNRLELFNHVHTEDGGIRIDIARNCILSATILRLS